MTIIEEIENLTESWDLEVKASQGADGRGAISSDFWPTYSAFANTKGGYIILGAIETENGFKAIGISDYERVEQDLWNTLANPTKVSINLLSESNVSRKELDGKVVFFVKIPRAERARKPVYINNNPMIGTYCRIKEGDHKCSAADVQKMLADASTVQTRDAIILENFSISDLDSGTIKTYRNLLASHNPNHPFLQSDDTQLLTQVKAISTNRETGVTGITVAGLLLFGKYHSILDYYPQFFLDYRELPNERDRFLDERWIDRVTPDGTWAGNLLSFYLRVLLKLTAGLRVPYQTDANLLRTEETRVHTALKEAFLNSLVHANFGDSKGIRIFRSPNKFEFYNPGTLLIDPDSLDLGGRSESRNPILQDMFRLIGIGERAGSGVPAIMRAWKEQQWKPPQLEDDSALSETHLVLNMVHLFPPEIVSSLTERFGERFSSLSHTKRLALCLAASDSGVTNKQVQKLSDEHGRDITYILRELVNEGFLTPHGEKQGRRYSISASQNGSTLGSVLVPENTRLLHNNTSSVQSESEVITLAEQVRTKKRAAKEMVMRAILEVCGGPSSKSLDEVAHALGRSPETLRVHYFSKLVAEGAITMLYPDRPNHPQQAYFVSK